jgi:hypothetical protein
MKSMTNVGIWDFFTAGTPLAGSAGVSGGYPPNWTGHTNAITLKEIMAGMHLYNDGRAVPSAHADSIADTLLKNLQENGLQMVMGIAGLKVADKLLGKAGVWRNTNKMLKAVGVKDIVKV